MDDFLQSEYKRAQALFSQGNYQDSKKIIIKLIEAYPKVADLFNFLGVLCTAEKNLVEGSKAFQNALKIRPNFPVANACYAQLLIDFRNLEDAKKYLKTAIDQEQQIPEFYINLGLLYIELRSYNEARSIAEIANSKFENYPPILNLLGISLLNLGFLNEAHESLSKALKIAPNYSEAHLNIGNTLMRLNDFEGSKTHFEKAFILDKNNPVCFEFLAKFYSTVELNFTKAINKLKDGLDITFNDHQKHLLLAQLYDCYIFMGEKKEAIEIGKILLKSNDSEIFIKAFYGLSKIKYFNSLNCEAVKKANQIVKKDSNSFNLTLYHFSLANINKINSDAKNYVKNLKTGNSYLEKFYDLRDSIKEKENIKHNELIKLVIKNSSKLSYVYKNDELNFNPIFIVGMPRSGSTLLDQILSSHSLVDSVGEITFFSKSNIIEPFVDFLKNNNSNDFDNFEAFVKNLREGYINRIRKVNPSMNFFVDKTLSNYLYMDLILCAFPNAKFINIQREIKSNAWSIYKNPFKDGFYNWTCDLNKIFNIYEEYNTFIKKYLNKYESCFINLSYEDLVLNNEQTVLKALNFLGLDFEQNCLQHYKNKKAVTTLSAEQVREKIYDSSINEWKLYKDFFPELRK